MFFLSSLFLHLLLNGPYNFHIPPLLELNCLRTSECVCRWTCLGRSGELASESAAQAFLLNIISCFGTLAVLGFSAGFCSLNYNLDTSHRRGGYLKHNDKCSKKKKKKDSVELLQYLLSWWLPCHIHLITHLIGHENLPSSKIQYIDTKEKRRQIPPHVVFRLLKSRLLLPAVWDLWRSGQKSNLKLSYLII